MSAPQLKLVTNDDPTDRELAEIQREIDEAKKAGAIDRVKKPIDVLPPNEQPRYDDLCNTERFLQIFGENLHFAAQPKKWLFWTGTHWEFDTTNFVFEIVADFTKDLYSSENCVNEVAFKHAKRSNNKGGLNAILELGRQKKTVDIEKFDTQPKLLNCANGTLNLETGAIRPHDRHDWITRVVNADYNADAISPTFERFLETVQPDPAIRAFLQRSIGYSLLGEVRERSFWILHGTGNNGKSIFVNLFNNLLGEYASATTTASVMAGKQNSIPNDIARLRGKRFIIIPETEENERLNSALVKALSAGDKVTARFLFGEFFDFYFSGKLWIATNHKPRITDFSKGFWDRLKLIPFSQDIPKDKVIKADDLMRSLMNERSGILNWAVTGCRDYFDLGGLEVPKVIQDEIDSYRYEQDVVLQFFDEWIETIEDFAKENDYVNHLDFRTENTKLWEAYKKFCKTIGVDEKFISQPQLTRKLKDRGFVQYPDKGKRIWKGIRLKPDVDI